MRLVRDSYSLLVNFFLSSDNVCQLSRHIDGLKSIGRLNFKSGADHSSWMMPIDRLADMEEKLRILEDLNMIYIRQIALSLKVKVFS